MGADDDVALLQHSVHAVQHLRLPGPHHMDLPGAHPSPDVECQQLPCCGGRGPEGGGVIRDKTKKHIRTHGNYFVIEG